MAHELKLPLRPSNDKDFKIDKRAKDCLTHTVLFGVRNATAFALYYPEYTAVSGARQGDMFKLSEVGQRYCNQFFSKDDHKNYQASYRATLKAFLSGRGDMSDDDSADSAIITEEQKNKAVKAYLLNVIKLLKTGDIDDPDTMKVLTDIVNKVGWLKGDEEQQLPPQRYLPEQCLQCRYRLFVDNGKKNGDLIDECQYCKALKFANNNGYRDTDETRLDLPKELNDNYQVKE